MPAPTSRPSLARRLAHICAMWLLAIAAASIIPPQATAQQRTTQRSASKTKTTAKTQSKSTKTAKTQPKSTKSQPRTSRSVSDERESTRRKINETTTRLNANAQELKHQLNSLNSLNADIARQQAAVGQLRSRVDSISTAINLTTDSIRILEADLEAMRRTYAHALHAMQGSDTHLDALSFIFSSRSFAEASARLRYLQRFSLWRTRRTEAIDKAVERIGSQRQHLASLRNSQDKALRAARDEQQSLSLKQRQSEKAVRDLRSQDTQLRAELARQKKQAAALDRELDRIIAAEQARRERDQAAARKAAGGKQQSSKGSSPGNAGSAADTPSAAQVASSRAVTRTAAGGDGSDLSGPFASNKGRLLFPVAGRYKIVRPFGRHPHPTQRHVVTDNSGIDIEVQCAQAGQAQARAVFAGEVSAIFQQDGFHTIVMVRHGSYLTVYAGLASAAVKVGQKVKAGQSLGTIYSDPSDGGRTILHFEVRNERSKLNPSSWVQ